VNPRTLRALLPVLREAREAGVLELEAGEGENRIRVKLAKPHPAGGEEMESGTDPGAQDVGTERDPNRILMEHYRLHGTANSVNGSGE
jgi:hypothetical protein